MIRHLAAATGFAVAVDDGHLGASSGRPQERKS